MMVWGSIGKCPGQLAMKVSWERHFGEDGGRLFARQHSLSDAAVVRSLIDDAGFRHANVTAAIGEVRLPSPGHLARSYGAMADVKADEATRTAVINEITASLQRFVGVDGLVYPIEAILASARK